MSVSYTTANRLKPARISVCDLIGYLNKTLADTQATESKDIQKQQQIFKGFVVLCFRFLCLQFLGGGLETFLLAKNLFPMEEKSLFSHTT